MVMVILPEGQRKACFEECDAQKKDNADKVARLKKEVKELQVAFAKAKNVGIVYLIL